MDRSFAAVLAFAVLAVFGIGVATPSLAAKPATAAARSSAPAKQAWEGFWAKNRKDCINRDGPDSKTMIDLKGVENGRPAPLYDQYENHCRIDSHLTQGNVTTLKLTCFEFWDDYRAKNNPRPDTVKLSIVDQQQILMNGTSYMRCKK